MTGVLLGTPGFMPPERASSNDDVPDPRTDIWAVGATLYVLASGKEVHEADDPMAMLAATSRKPVRSLRDAAPFVRDDLVAVVDRALAFEKGARWRTALEMKRALGEETVTLEQALPDERSGAPSPQLRGPSPRTVRLAGAPPKAVVRVADSFGDLALEETVAAPMMEVDVKVRSSSSGAASTKRPQAIVAITLVLCALLVVAWVLAGR
jgi:serine/threonine protein kinase